MCVISNEGEGPSSIISANMISEVISRVIATVSEIHEVVEEIIENFGNSLVSIVRSVMDRVLRLLRPAPIRLEKKKTYSLSAAIALAIAVRIRVGVLAASFLECAHLLLLACIMRTQDKDSGEISDGDYGCLVPA